MANGDSQNEGGRSDYPVQFSVDYQESSNRLSVLPRILLAIPILVLSAFIGGFFDMGDPDLNEALMPIYAGGFPSLRTPADDRVPQKVSEVVVQLEP